MIILSTILYLVVAVAITFGLVALGRKYVFSRVRINKWVVLAIAALLFVGQIYLGNKNTINNFLFMIPTLWFFLWFMELQNGTVVRKQEKKIVIKSKAKPNRAKHLYKDNK